MKFEMGTLMGKQEREGQPGMAGYDGRVEYRNDREAFPRDQLV